MLDLPGKTKRIPTRLEGGKREDKEKGGLIGEEEEERLDEIL